MLRVAKISAQLAQIIQGKEYKPFSKFNPFEIGENWYVSVKESEFLNDSDFEIVEININFE